MMEENNDKLETKLMIGTIYGCSDKIKLMKSVLIAITLILIAFVGINESFAETQVSDNDNISSIKIINDDDPYLLYADNLGLIKIPYQFPYGQIDNVYVNHMENHSYENVSDGTVFRLTGFSYGGFLEIDMPKFDYTQQRNYFLSMSDNSSISETFDSSGKYMSVKFLIPKGDFDISYILDQDSNTMYIPNPPYYSLDKSVLVYDDYDQIFSPKIQDDNISAEKLESLENLFMIDRLDLRTYTVSYTYEESTSSTPIYTQKEFDIMYAISNATVNNIYFSPYDGFGFDLTAAENGDLILLIESNSPLGLDERCGEWFGSFLFLLQENGISNDGDASIVSIQHIKPYSIVHIKFDSSVRHLFGNLGDPAWSWYDQEKCIFGKLYYDVHGFPTVKTLNTFFGPDFMQRCNSNSDLEVVVDKNYERFICVKSDTKMKLIERGWAFNYSENLE